jgi:CxxC-x17-CxxC domain-containing protein
MNDVELKCVSCSKQFVWTATEQEFFREKGLTNVPKRCSSCRVLTRLQRQGVDPARATSVSCEGCGTMTVVPFQPKGYKPVYCSYCFHTMKSQPQLSRVEEPETQSTQQIM